MSVPMHPQVDRKNDAQHDEQAAEEFGVSLEALDGGEGFRMVQSQLGLGPLKSIDRSGGIKRIEIVFLDLYSLANRLGHILLDDGPSQQPRPEGGKLLAADYVRDLLRKSRRFDPVIHIVIEWRADQENKMAQQVAYDEEDGEFVRARLVFQQSP